VTVAYESDFPWTQIYAGGRDRTHSIQPARLYGALPAPVQVNSEQTVGQESRARFAPFLNNSRVQACVTASTHLQTHMSDRKAGLELMKQ
jgi:hypothetical protein